MGDWTEKYRPKSLDDIVGNERAIIDLRNWASSWNRKIPKKRAVILSGKPGIGKTSAALALSNDFGWTTIELNTSDARNAEKIKKVATFGAINETFSEDGRFISSLEGGRKLIILDEADNLYEKTGNYNNRNNDLSDKGGKKAIIDTIKITQQPIILIVNDYYNLIKGSGEVLKHICKLIRFYNPYSSSIFNLLKKICLKEAMTVDQKVLQTIIDRCKGDIRSAINDLQALSVDRKQVDIKSLNILGYRDREKDIFNTLREIFKTKNIKAIRENLSNVDIDPKLRILWICENLPVEYIDNNDLTNAYNSLSKADIFLGRTAKSQNYSLWSYACDIMNGGVAIAKTRNYPNNNYNFPSWLKEKKKIKGNIDIKNLIVEKISNTCHNSKNKGREFLQTYFSHMFKNSTHFAIKMKNKFDFSEAEIKYLLGKSHQYKLKEILLTRNIPAENQNNKKLEKSYEEDKKEEMQQSLFDF
jgi:replication factor C large subunit